MRRFMSSVIVGSDVLLPTVAFLFSLLTSGANAASYSVFYSFPGGRGGGVPIGPLLTDGSGKVYGTTLEGGTRRGGHGVAYRISQQGKERVLFKFGGAKGAYPYSGMISDNAGNFYGTTFQGGIQNGYCGKRGCGAVFKIASDGIETVLHEFQGIDGACPYAGLIMDGAGNLYGTTSQGGTKDEGTVFKVTPGGTETVLHNFQEGTTDGGLPFAGVIMDSNGNLYGTTVEGGDPGYGIIYELASDGTFTVLHSFTGLYYGGVDGEEPWGGLIMDSGGNLYGTAVAGGGSNACPVGQGCGAVFKLSPDGTEVLLHAFSGSDGANPYYGLAMDASGNLYGVTTYGGATGRYCSTSGCGVVFEVAPDGTETTLHMFQGGSDGSAPESPLTWNSNNLYGTAIDGGAFGDGTVFKVTP